MVRYIPRACDSSYKSVSAVYSTLREISQGTFDRIFMLICFLFLVVERFSHNAGILVHILILLHDCIIATDALDAFPSGIVLELDTAIRFYIHYGKRYIA